MTRELCSMMHVGRLVSHISGHSPLAELLEDDSVGEPLSADSDSLQHTVTPQLLQDQVSIQLPCLSRAGTFHYTRFYQRTTQATFSSNEILVYHNCSTFVHFPPKPKLIF